MKLTFKNPEIRRYATPGTLQKETDSTKDNWKRSGRQVCFIGEQRLHNLKVQQDFIGTFTYKWTIEGKQRVYGRDLPWVAFHCLCRVLIHWDYRGLRQQDNRRIETFTIPLHDLALLNFLTTQYSLLCLGVLISSMQKLSHLTLPLLDSLVLHIVQVPT